MKFGPYSWVVLAILAATRICFQWQRSVFSYSYGYTGIDYQAQNKFYELSTAYPELSKYFGVLTGLAYTVPFALCGLIFGKITPKVNRKVMLAVNMVLCGLVMTGVSVLDSFAFLAASRVMLGTISAFINSL